MTFKDIASKNEVMKAKYRLSKSRQFNHVIIEHDKTRDQRTNESNLQAIAKVLGSRVEIRGSRLIVKDDKHERNGNNGSRSHSWQRKSYQRRTPTNGKGNGGRQEGKGDYDHRSDSHRNDRDRGGYMHHHDNTPRRYQQGVSHKEDRERGRGRDYHESAGRRYQDRNNYRQDKNPSRGRQWNSPDRSQNGRQKRHSSRHEDESYASPAIAPVAEHKQSRGNGKSYRDPSMEIRPDPLPESHKDRDQVQREVRRRAEERRRVYGED